METIISFIYLIIFFVGLPLGVFAADCIRTGKWKETFNKENLKKQTKYYIIFLILGVLLLAFISAIKTWMTSKN
jgi:hypothetical protein